MEHYVERTEEDPESEAVESQELDITLEVGAGNLPVIYFPKREAELKNNPHKRYIGIDIDRDDLQEGKKFVNMDSERSSPEKTLYTQAYAGKLPLADNSVNEIVSRNVLGDPRDIVSPATFKELARVLKLGRRIKIIEDYTPDWARRWFRKWGHLMPTNLKLVKTTTSEDLLENPNLEEVDDYHLKNDLPDSTPQFRHTIWEFEKIAE